MAFFLLSCCESTAQDDAVIDISSLDERAPTLLTQTAQRSGDLEKAPNENMAGGTENLTGECTKEPTEHSARKSSAEDAENVGLERYAGWYYHPDGTCLGQIEGHLMKWACDSPPSKVRLSSSGELLVEMDGEVYTATFENNAWRFNDGDVWTKAE